MQIFIDKPYFLLDRVAKLSVETKKVAEDAYEVKFSQSLPLAKSFTIQGNTHHLQEIVESLNKVLGSSQ